MLSREGWERGDAGPKVIKGKTYKNLVEFTRPCQSCGVKFSIFVTERIANGHADSNSFGLRNCEQHRRAGTVTNSDLASLRTANDSLNAHAAAMETEHKSLMQSYETVFARAQVLEAENATLRARLAKYELSAATFETIVTDFTIGCEPVQNTTASEQPMPGLFPWSN